MTYRYSALCCAIIAVLASGNALANEQTTTQQDARQAGDKPAKTLTTVQVSATKRDTPLQKTPVAISAISADTLNKDRVMTVQDITKMVPGFEATSEGDHGVITLTMRGIGNDSAKTEYADPEVATFVDGVYAPRAEAAASLLLDIDRVDVMRGPQGTLWGRNSTVGAVNFVSAKPELGDFYGNAQMSTGNYNQIGARAAVNLPISDTFALRVAVAQQQHDGYVDYQNPVSQIPSVAQQQSAYLASGGNPAGFQPINPNLFVTRGDKYNAQDQSAARVSALWQPVDQFTWNLSFEYFRDHGTPGANLMQHPRTGQDFWSALVDTAPYLDRNSKAVRSRMDWDINDAMTLSYVAGFSRYSGKSDYDQDSGVTVPTSFTTGGIFQEDRTNYSNYRNSSHELDLKSRGKQTFDWILGLYYAEEDNNMRFDIPVMNGTSLGSVSWQGSFIQPKETVHSEAIFGQSTWNITDHLRLTGGLRYSKDKKENVGGRGWGWAYDPTLPQTPISTGTQPGPDTNFAVSTYNDGKYKANHTTWLVRMDADVGENGLLYASVSNGYKAGGTQDGGTVYKAETLVNYEIGSKFSFLDGHLTWNSAIYYENFKNFQLSAPITYPDGNRGLGFSNVKGATKVFGIESELAAQFGQDDRLNFVFSAIPKKKLGTLRYAGSNDYAGLPPCAPESGIDSCIDITGNDLAHAPNVSMTLAYEHDFRFANGGRLTPRLTAHYQSTSWLSPFNLGDGDQQKSYTRGDFSMRYHEPQDRWWVGLYVQNITDGKVRTNAGRFVLPNGSYAYVSQYLPPRTYGVNVGVWF